MPSPNLLPVKLPAWGVQLKRKLPRPGERDGKRDIAVLRDGVRAFAPFTAAPAKGTLAAGGPEKASSKKKHHPLALSEQPFDSLILSLSPLFRLSRKTYLKQGGTFLATLLSSPRTLSSTELLEQRIEYSPIERELIWSATDPVESRGPQLTRLFETRGYSTSLFHEQNHRILWKFLPPPPPVRRKGSEVFRFLNFVESLVVTLDMALGDELGPEFSQILYLSGVAYDPGTRLREKSISRRTYRNYLHACLYATYLTLELYEKKDVEKAVTYLYPSNLELTKRAIQRACRLDEAFVRITNLDWQEKNYKRVVKKLSRSGVPPLVLTENALDHRLQYLWAEKWFEKMGL
jgi:hypothetical protein